MKKFFFQNSNTSLRLFYEILTKRIKQVTIWQFFCVIVQWRKVNYSILKMTTMLLNWTIMTKMINRKNQLKKKDQCWNWQVLLIWVVMEFLPQTVFLTNLEKKLVLLVNVHCVKKKLRVINQLLYGKLCNSVIPSVSVSILIVYVYAMGLDGLGTIY